jgi:hypothetical protein
MNRLMRAHAGAAALAGVVLLAPGAPAGAGMLPASTAILAAAAPHDIVTVQWGYIPLEGSPFSWDYKWGAPPYYFPYGRTSRVIYYPGSSYYFPGFQTIYGYNGHFGHPAAAQYANPPRRMHRPPLGD